jgi:hypothetical protein
MTLPLTAGEAARGAYRLPVLVLRCWLRGACLFHCPRIIRVARTVLPQGAITCGLCGGEFEIAG